MSEEQIGQMLEYEYIMVYMRSHAEELSIEIESLIEELHQEKQTKSAAEKAFLEERDEFEKTREQLQSELESLNEELRQEKLKKSAAVKALQKERDEFKKTHEQLQSELESLNEELRREKLTKSAAVKSLQKERDEFKKTHEQLQAELKSLNEELCQEKLTKSTALHKKRDEFEQVQSKLESLNEELKDVKNGLEGAARNITLLSSQKQDALEEVVTLRTILDTEITRYGEDYGGMFSLADHIKFKVSMYLTGLICCIMGPLYFFAGITFPAVSVAGGLCLGLSGISYMGTIFRDSDILRLPLHWLVSVLLTSVVNVLSYVMNDVLDQSTMAFIGYLYLATAVFSCLMIVQPVNDYGLLQVFIGQPFYVLMARNPHQFDRQYLGLFVLSLVINCCQQYLVQFFNLRHARGRLGRGPQR